MRDPNIYKLIHDEADAARWRRISVLPDNQDVLFALLFYRLFSAQEFENDLVSQYGDEGRIRNLIQILEDQPLIEIEPQYQGAHLVSKALSYLDDYTAPWPAKDRQFYQMLRQFPPYLWEVFIAYKDDLSSDTVLSKLDAFNALLRVWQADGYVRFYKTYETKNPDHSGGADSIRKYIKTLTKEEQIAIVKDTHVASIIRDMLFNTIFASVDSEEVLQLARDVISFLKDGFAFSTLEYVAKKNPEEAAQLFYDLIERIEFKYLDDLLPTATRGLKGRGAIDFAFKLIHVPGGRYQSRGLRLIEENLDAITPEELEPILNELNVPSPNNPTGFFAASVLKKALDRNDGAKRHTEVARRILLSRMRMNEISVQAQTAPMIISHLISEKDFSSEEIQEIYRYIQSLNNAGEKSELLMHLYNYFVYPFNVGVREMFTNLLPKEAIDILSNNEEFVNRFDKGFFRLLVSKPEYISELAILAKRYEEGAYSKWLSNEHAHAVIGKIIDLQAFSYRESIEQVIGGKEIEKFVSQSIDNQNLVVNGILNAIDRTDYYPAIKATSSETAPPALLGAFGPINERLLVLSLLQSYPVLATHKRFDLYYAVGKRRGIFQGNESDTSNFVTLAKEVNALYSQFFNKITHGEKLKPEEYEYYDYFLSSIDPKYRKNSNQWSNQEGSYTALATQFGLPAQEVGDRAQVLRQVDEQLDSIPIKPASFTFNFQAEDVSVSISDKAKKEFIGLVDAIIGFSGIDREETILQKVASIDFQQITNIASENEGERTAAIEYAVNTLKVPESIVLSNQKSDRKIENIQNYVLKDKLDSQDILYIVRQSLVTSLGLDVFIKYQEGRLSTDETSTFLEQLLQMDIYLEDGLTTLGIPRPLAISVKRSTLWKPFILLRDEIVKAKQRGVRKDHKIELIFQKKNLLDVWQGKCSGTCFGDYPHWLSKKNNLFTMRILEDGDMMGNLLFVVQKEKMILIGFDPSEAFTKKLTDAKKRQFVDIAMNYVWATAKLNSWELSIAEPEQVGGISNKSDIAEYITSVYINNELTTKIEKEGPFHPEHGYELTTVHPVNSAVMERMGRVYEQEIQPQQSQSVESSPLPVKIEVVGPETWDSIKDDVMGVENAAFSGLGADEALLKEDFTNSKNIVVIARDNITGKVIGFIYAEPEEGDTVSISDLAVHPDYQGGAVFASLTLRMVWQLRLLGVEFVELDAAYYNGLADTMQRMFARYIVETNVHESQYGPQRFFRLQLTKPTSVEEAARKLVDNQTHCDTAFFPFVAQVYAQDGNTTGAGGCGFWARLIGPRGRQSAMRYLWQMPNRVLRNIFLETPSQSASLQPVQPKFSNTIELADGAQVAHMQQLFRNDTSRDWGEIIYFNIQHITDGSFRAYLAKDTQGNPTGLAIVNVSLSNPDVPGQVAISELAVLPTVQDTGIGTQLVLHIQSVYPAIRLQIGENLGIPKNIQAVDNALRAEYLTKQTERLCSFYENLGFRHVPNSIGGMVWESVSDLQPHITDLQAKVEKDFADTLAKVEWQEEGKAKEAVTKIVDEAFIRQYQDRAPPFTQDQRTSIISSVVTRILGERTQKALPLESLIQTKPQQTPINRQSWWQTFLDQGKRVWETVKTQWQRFWKSSERGSLKIPISVRLPSNLAVFRLTNDGLIIQGSGSLSVGEQTFPIGLEGAVPVFSKLSKVSEQSGYITRVTVRDAKNTRIGNIDIQFSLGDTSVESIARKIGADTAKSIFVIADVGVIKEFREKGIGTALKEYTDTLSNQLLAQMRKYPEQYPSDIRMFRYIVDANSTDGFTSTFAKSHGYQTIEQGVKYIKEVK